MSGERRRVVITGMGAVTPIGHTIEDIYSSLRKGHCAIGPITAYDTEKMKAKVAGEVKDFDPEEYLDRKTVWRMDRVNQLGVIAGLKAAEHAGLTKDYLESQLNAGTIVSSGIGGLMTIETEHQRGLKRGYDRISPFFIPMVIVNMTAAEIAIELGLHGHCSCPVAACAGGPSAIGEGFRMVLDGFSDIMFVGGSEASITPLGMGGFTAMKALTLETDPNRASIPFDKDRSGFVMGEGAGVMVLESLESALKRNATIYAEVVGFGSTCDAGHITAPQEDGKWAALAMTKALEDAGITPDQVDYINAHGTSTPLNDHYETTAVRAAFGEHADRLAISSTKSMIGHLLGAAGAVEGIVTALALHKGYIPPTINYREKDPIFDLDIVPNQGRDSDIRYALSNSFGFGGHNTSVCFKKWSDR